LSVLDVCDAHPYLLRAARYHGEATNRTCPMCRREPLVEVTYTYGDCFKEATNGRVRQRAELAELAADCTEFTVYVVEVCRGCSWNHLTISYVLGRSEPSARPGKRIAPNGGPNGRAAGSAQAQRAAEE
jgi:hypothetical protein